MLDQTLTPMATLVSAAALYLKLCAVSCNACHLSLNVPLPTPYKLANVIPSLLMHLGCIPAIPMRDLCKIYLRATGLLLKKKSDIMAFS